MSGIEKIYASVSPITVTTHGDVSIKPANGLEFSRGILSIPVVAAEFPSIAQDMAIVFTGEGDAIVPVALTSVKEGENAYLNEDGKWTGRYIPAFLRRYPFIFARSDEDTMTLCLDETYEGLNREGVGERLFDAEGNQTQYLKSMLGFVTQYQRQHIATQVFCKRLVAMDLLEPAVLRAKDSNGEIRRLGGFHVINKKKLKLIPDEELLGMFRSDELELCYLHMHSLQNLERQVSNSHRAEASTEKTADVEAEAPALLQ